MLSDKTKFHNQLFFTDKNFHKYVVEEIGNVDKLLEKIEMIQMSQDIKEKEFVPIKFEYVYP